ncbi:MAG TPA: glycoside hydrolase family 43 protein [Candidatus Paceibacterota bacterium]|nr:glycoside hydrolase family 43 protein [Verrucomicrobiota bacterium]HSA09021.1 glycoside hydrolase family 43 protein [Candidatus Paceibacterota bacterium]
MRRLTITLLLSAVAVGLCACNEPPPPAAPAPARTYRNPLLPERVIADPFILRLDGTYYLYGTTDGRGYEVFVSTNLVDWESKGRAFTDPRGGAWAPEVFHHERGDGKFYLYYTDNLPGEQRGPLEKQVGVAVADSPLGPFTDKAALASHSIDAHLFQDDDGSLYLYYVDLSGGFKILVQPMADPLTKRGEPKVLIRPEQDWEKANGEVTEGPFILKRQGTYYLTYSGSGADTPDYAIGYATSQSPSGPFVRYAGNPIARRGGSVIGPGHHCVVEGPDGKLWLVYHQKWNAERGWRRFLALDPIWFDEQGVLHTKLSRGTDQPAP